MGVRQREPARVTVGVGDSEGESIEASDFGSENESGKERQWE